MVYLPANVANGLQLTITGGQATVYAGEPDAASQRVVAVATAGDSFTVSGLSDGEVLSVEDDEPFWYTFTAPPPAPTTTTTGPEPTSTTTEPEPTSTTSAPTTTTMPPSTTTSTVPPSAALSSQSVVWSCAGSPCPWGTSTSGNAAVWPAELGPTNSRLGYSVSAAIYLAAGPANGLRVTIVSGQASVFAGAPGAASHRLLGSLSAGQSFTVSGVGATEVVSVQNDAASFTYSFTVTATPAPTTTTTTTPPTSTTTPPTTTTPTTTSTTTSTTSTTTTSTTTTEPPTTTTEPPVVGWLSQPVVWSCAGSPCPWGTSLSGNAAVWPAELGPSSTRLGYSTSVAIYLPAANGLVITVTSGEAAVFAGAPSASSHRLLGWLTAGQSLTVSGLGVAEVVSVQNDVGAFTYTFSAPEPPPPTTTTPTTTEPPTSSTTTTTTEPPASSTTTTGPEPATTTSTVPPTSTTSTTEPPAAGSSSQPVVWSCTGSPCPWGVSLSGNAIVWPAELAASDRRLGYTASHPIYLEATNGLSITVTSGWASVYAGAPSASSHRLLDVLTAGDSLTITGVSAGEVISVQSDEAPFTYLLDGDPEPAPTTTTIPEPEACTDPLSCDVVTSIRSRWRCDVPDCFGDDWVGGVIAWPAWSAYESNARRGSMSRTVYAESGELLYPYMGPWADGCKITAVFDYVLIVEWERGVDHWRATYLSPGQSHTIDLQEPENNVLIETPDTPTTFGIRLENCTPQPIDKS